MAAPAFSKRAWWRVQLLQLVATTSSLAALAAMLDPDRIATAGLALLASRQVDQPVLGDLTALFLLAQPAGRLVAAFAIGLPTGVLLVVCAVELLAGLSLLALRPRGKILSP